MNPFILTVLGLCIACLTLYMFYWIGVLVVKEKGSTFDEKLNRILIGSITAISICIILYCCYGVGYLVYLTFQ